MYAWVESSGGESFVLSGAVVAATGLHMPVGRHIGPTGWVAPFAVPDRTANVAAHVSLEAFFCEMYGILPTCETEGGPPLEPKVEWVGPLKQHDVVYPYNHPAAWIALSPGARAACSAHHSLAESLPEPILRGVAGATPSAQVRDALAFAGRLANGSDHGRIPTTVTPRNATPTPALHSTYAATRWMNFVLVLTFSSLRAAEQGMSALLAGVSARSYSHCAMALGTWTNAAPVNPHASRAEAPLRQSFRPRLLPGRLRSTMLKQLDQRGRPLPDANELSHSGEVKNTSPHSQVGPALPHGLPATPNPLTPTPTVEAAVVAPATPST
jgi:hypothetical protein